MASLTELKRAIDTLPKGNVYRKVIKGHPYFYHQYSDHGERISKLISEEEVAPLLEKIKKRKALLLEYASKAKTKNIKLSLAARRLTGFVMMGDAPVAKFEEGELLWLDEGKAPYAIKRSRSLLPFLSLRVIDISRTNARLLKKAFAIHEEESHFLSLYAYAASISDNYWFKPLHSKLKYKDVTFDSDAFSDIALKGDTSFFPNRAHLTPELTTGGSFEKGWKKIDGEWWLYKCGSKKEIFSEMLSYELAKLFLLPSAVYEVDGDYIRSLNFAGENNYEPMAALFGQDDSYETIYSGLKEFPDAIKEEYLSMIFFDAWVNNVDRHNENCGFLRDAKTGDLLSLAPNFDNNLALIARSPLPEDPRDDGFIASFLRFVKGNEDARARYAKMVFPTIREEDIQERVEEVRKLTHYREEELSSLLFRRYEYLKKCVSIG